MKCLKTIGLTTFLIAVAALTVAPLCLAGKSDGETTAAMVKQESRELLQALKSYSAEQRDEVIQKSSELLAKIDQRIEALEVRIDKDWDKMDQSARKNARVSLKELRRQRTMVAEKFGSLKSGTVAAWENMKKGFTDAYKSLEAAWEKTEKEFVSDK